MRFGNKQFDCGCEDRRFIMFEAGRLGLTEAAILAFACGALVIAWRFGT